MKQNTQLRRAVPTEEGLRLLLDPYLCFAPGTEHHRSTLSEIARDAAALGLALCVEKKSWDEAATDPDVVRRQVPLGRFEPLLKIEELPLPSKRDLETRFMPARNDIDRADLRLLGALHARIVELLIADDGRLHRVASRAGLGQRVLTPSDALAWLEALAGEARELAVTEVEPRAALSNPTLESMLAEDCEPFDPYLASRLEAAGTRVLVANDNRKPVALGVITTEAPELTLAAIACADAARGSRAIEPVIAAALTFARRQRVGLRSLVPPHLDHVLLLLDLLGFERRGRDRHGRVIFHHGLDEAAARPGAGREAWLWPLDAASHDRLVPELAGATQSELFPSLPAPQTQGSPVRKQLLAGRASREPQPGDLLLLVHVRTPDRIRLASITAAARVVRTGHAATIGELLAQCAGQPCDSLARLRELVEAGSVSVFDLHWLGRLARPLPLSAMIELGVIGQASDVRTRLSAEALLRLAPELVLA
ncbi:MAG: hypothetical protein ACT4UQ_08005 [Gammaproteobacteria bacterium]